jgi:hypothetical protein
LFLHNNSISFGLSLRLICGLRYCPILCLWQGIAASLYGEGAMGVVTAILEHCLAALQASSIDDGTLWIFNLSLSQVYEIISSMTANNYEQAIDSAPV